MSRLAETGPDTARARLLDWLGEMGERWGLPAGACRAHGWLYLTGRAAAPAEIAQAASLSVADVASALAWLADHGLVEAAGPAGWRARDDPWELVMRAMEARRERELEPAMEVLRLSRRDAASDRVLATRIDRLLKLVEDVAAISAQARRLSPMTLRRLVGVGGHAARLLGRTFGSMEGRRK